MVLVRDVAPASHASEPQVPGPVEDGLPRRALACAKQQKLPLGLERRPECRFAEVQVMGSGREAAGPQSAAGAGRGRWLARSLRRPGPIALRARGASRRGWQARREQRGPQGCCWRCWAEAQVEAGERMPGQSALGQPRRAAAPRGRWIQAAGWDSASKPRRRSGAQWTPRSPVGRPACPGLQWRGHCARPSPVRRPTCAGTCCATMALG